MARNAAGILKKTCQKIYLNASKTAFQSHQTGNFTLITLFLLAPGDKIVPAFICSQTPSEMYN